MTTRDDEPVFIDTNVLVYAAVENAPLHDIAAASLKKYQDAGVQCWINRQVLREFMCIMTRPLRPCIRSHNTRDFEVFSDVITVMPLEP